LIHGDVPRHLQFSKEEHPVALQLGGSEPDDLARSAKLGEDYGYDEINLNIGCPSERVQRGAFGACLMAEPALVASCVSRIRDAVAIPVTVKHRIGIDKVEDYAFVRDFVGTVAQAGCRTFIAHARNAVLKGLSPKENREIPPLQYPTVYRLKREFPQLCVVINGGIRTLAECEEHLRHVDGVMLGREAYENPWLLAEADARLFGDAPAGATRESTLRRMLPYVERELAAGTPLGHITRHVLGLYRNRPGGRAFRRVISEQAHRAGAGIEVLEAALAQIESQPLEAVA
jgi:tRNA-dihydrouridine synthase A